MNEPCVIISPAGMLVGGSAVHYMQELCKSDKNGMLLCRIRRSTWKMLLERGLSFKGKLIKCHAAVRQFDFFWS